MYVIPGVLLGQDEGFGEEVEMTDSVPDLHPRNVFVHQVFASQMKRVGEMVNFLIGHQGLICLVLYN